MTGAGVMHGSWPALEQARNYVVGELNFSNVYRFVPLCSIFIVIVKFTTSAGHLAQGKGGEAHEQGFPRIFFVVSVPF